jgi:hypothetical protein
MDVAQDVNILVEVEHECTCKFSKKYFSCQPVVVNVLSVWLKQLGREADLSTESRQLSDCTPLYPLRHTPSWRCAYRDNFVVAPKSFYLLENLLHSWPVLP